MTLFGILLVCTALLPCASAAIRTHCHGTIPDAWRCDGRVNCFDQRDETNCRMCDRHGAFFCHRNLTCIPQNKRCDGRFQCPLGEDEENCPGRSVCPAQPSQVARGKRCNGRVQCRNVADEKQCTACTGNRFFCPESQRCILKHQRCNGLSECPFGEDERNCTALDCKSTHAFCSRERICTRNTDFCNGVEDCILGEDEFGCRGSEPKWNGLKVKWGPSITLTQFFVSQPRTVAEASNAGFVRLGDCDVNSNWRGARYTKSGDDALALLFDINGNIAGIQTSVDASSSYPPSSLQPPFVREGNKYKLTAYFVDPATICTTGRQNLTYYGTGSDLYIQNSPNPESSTKIPRLEKDIGSTLWTKGKCFPTMGQHYWYNLSADMDCNNFFPMFLLYNRRGQLDGFGWAMKGNLTSNHFEHPSARYFSAFMAEVPTCLYTAGPLSTMHIYLTNTIETQC